jgi:hypothetical protein
MQKFSHQRRKLVLQKIINHRSNHPRANSQSSTKKIAVVHSSSHAKIKEVVLNEGAWPNRLGVVARVDSNIRDPDKSNCKSLIRSHYKLH